MAATGYRLDGDGEIDYERYIRCAHDLRVLAINGMLRDLLSFIARHPSRRQGS